MGVSLQSPNLSFQLQVLHWKDNHVLGFLFLFLRLLFPLLHLMSWSSLSLPFPFPFPFCTPLMLMMTGDPNIDNFAGLSHLSYPLTLRPKASTPSSSMIMVFLSLSLVLVFLSLPASDATTTTALCNQADQDSLLSFSSNLSFSGQPLNWSPPSDCCNWEGVVCDTNDGRVTSLSLSSRGLSGYLSPSLANLTQLSYLNLSYNRLTGLLPDRFFSSLANLRVLDLSYNTLSGELPFYPTNSPGNISIQVVNLSSNLFSGVIIPSISFLQAAWNLSSFNVSNNSFMGQIPSDICQISSSAITELDFSYNDFNGSIPSGLGECSNLQILCAGFNDLSGTIPDDIYNTASLKELSLPLNHLTGEINAAINNLSNLHTLELYSNNLTGTIPHGIGRLYKLEYLLLHINNLTGFLPPSLSNCTNLIVLNLRVNSLIGQLSAFNFSTFLQLTTLDLGNNNFTGNLPSSLCSCTSLTAVRLANNKLEGQILPSMHQLQSLLFLSVSNNNLSNVTGAIRILMGCKSLTTLILSTNFKYEVIPADVDTVDGNGFANLQIFALGGSMLSGQVPQWLANLKNLELLDLSVNQLTGPIPDWLGNLSKLFYMDLSNNHLSGEFPTELTQLAALSTPGGIDNVNRSYLPLPVFAAPTNATNQQYNQLGNMPRALYLANNSLTGEIPPQIGQLKFLHVLDLSHNDFSGNIPDQLSNMTNLEKLDLSWNQLSGEIPASLKSLHFLSSFSIADNNLQGPIPTGGQFDTFSASSFEGNTGLCGSVLQRSCSTPGTFISNPSHDSSNTKVVVGVVVGVCFGTGLVITGLALWILSKRRIIPGGENDNIEMETVSSNSYSGIRSNVEKDASVVMLFPTKTNEIKDLTIAELLKATDNFNQANIVGCGGFGLVYKATLADGTKLAVKKLSGDMGLLEREFKAEVEALSTAQHENLVTLQGYVVHNGFQMLIYSFMENGSLDYWLHEKPDGASQLDWPTRLKIARGASTGLAYMHQICEPHIVHRDIKSSNILLDDKFEAHVADFGLARLILPYRTHVTTELVGTLGYIPPEYGQAWVATLRGDVYSFGVVMLELLTGKRPVEVFKTKNSRELVGWVQLMRSEGKPEQVFDPILKGKGFEGEMMQVLDVACICVNQNPFKRPTIQEVVDWLKAVGYHREQVKG